MSTARYLLVACVTSVSMVCSLPVMATGVTAGMGSTSSIGSADIHGITRQALRENRVHPDKPHGDASRTNAAATDEKLTDKCQQTGADTAAGCESL